MVERSTVVRFFRWLCTWRTQRRILIGVAWLVTLVALLHAEENWRGWHAWSKYRHALEARGGHVDLKEVIPPPVPDEQNFAATPVVKSWFMQKTFGGSNERWDDSYSKVENQVHRPWKKGVPASRHFEDLVGWAAGFAALRSGTPKDHENFYSGKLDPESRAEAAPAVLEGLKTNEALFAELRLASRRPYSRYPINYDTADPWSIPLPHISMVKGVCQRLALKACAELASGQSEQALDDVRLLLRVGDSLKSDPFLISYLVRIACVQLGMQTIWEGLAEHRWSDAQLQELETRLQQYTFISDTRPVFDGERAEAVSAIELIRKEGLGYLNSLGSGESKPLPGQGMLARLLLRVAFPRGWFYFEELNYCRSFHLQVASGLDFTNNRASPACVKANAEALERAVSATGFAGTEVGIALRHQIMTRLMLPALTRVMYKAAAAQTAVNQAAIACALERYRLANGHFPEKLDALAPQFISPLPNDVVTGEPYKYHRADDGQFVLYSIGWDEKDDGGVPGKNLFDEHQGDWVWEYPAK